MEKVFIIAEAGINHNGNMKIAKKMVEAASNAGADAIKFQVFKADRVISRYAPKAEYQKKTTSVKESQLDMAKKLELNYCEFKELYNECKTRGIKFLATPFDSDSIDFLQDLGLETLKIPSGEITNLPYLRRIGRLKKKIIISTGMADLKEIKNALEVLINEGVHKKNITILHCNTEYPTPFEDVNLLAMLTIRDTFKVNVGYSDHTSGIEVPIAAVALGATVIEKHFTLDKEMQGPDHKASLNPAELELMVRAIRNIEKALGNGLKRPSASEAKNKAVARRSILAASNIRKGEVFTKQNLTAKRPGTGISPMEWDNVIGKIAKRNFIEDELIEL